MPGSVRRRGCLARPSPHNRFVPDPHFSAYGFEARRPRKGREPVVAPPLFVALLPQHPATPDANRRGEFGQELVYESAISIQIAM